MNWKENSMNMNKKGRVEGKRKLCHVVVSVRRAEEEEEQ